MGLEIRLDTGGPNHTLYGTGHVVTEEKLKEQNTADLIRSPQTKSLAVKVRGRTTYLNGHQLERIRGALERGELTTRELIPSIQLGKHTLTAASLLAESSVLRDLYSEGWDLVSGKVALYCNNPWVFRALHAHCSKSGGIQALVDKLDCDERTKLQKEAGKVVEAFAQLGLPCPSDALKVARIPAVAGNDGWDSKIIRRKSHQETLLTQSSTTPSLSALIQHLRDCRTSNLTIKAPPSEQQHQGLINHILKNTPSNVGKLEIRGIKGGAELSAGALARLNRLRSLDFDKTGSCAILPHIANCSELVSLSIVILPNQKVPEWGQAARTLTRLALHHMPSAPWEPTTAELNALPSKLQSLTLRLTRAGAHRFVKCAKRFKELRNLKLTIHGERGNCSIGLNLVAKFPALTGLVLAGNAISPLDIAQKVPSNRKMKHLTFSPDWAVGVGVEARSLAEKLKKQLSPN